MVCSDRNLLAHLRRAFRRDSNVGLWKKRKETDSSNRPDTYRQVGSGFVSVSGSRAAEQKPVWASKHRLSEHMMNPTEPHRRLSYFSRAQPLQLFL